MQQLSFALPQRGDFGIVLAAELLQAIDFPLDGRLFALASQALNGTHAFCRRRRGSCGRGNARDELGLHRI
jgi:hypothetical protein